MNDIKTAFNECLNIHANKLKLSMNRINKQKVDIGNAFKKHKDCYLGIEAGVGYCSGHPKCKLCGAKATEKNGNS